MGSLWSDAQPLRIGGPGCTSLKGGFEELGQLVFNRASFTANTTAAPELFYNPLGWTKLSTMLYFESPPGVGFSYCDECLGNSTCDCVANDLTTAEDNHDALVSFFKGFPELSQNDFYITGESPVDVLLRAPRLRGLVCPGRAGQPRT